MHQSRFRSCIWIYDDVSKEHRMEVFVLYFMVLFGLLMIAVSMYIKGEK